jgi:hypothetical protein
MKLMRVLPDTRLKGLAGFPGRYFENVLERSPRLSSAG